MVGFLPVQRRFEAQVGVFFTYNGPAYGEWRFFDCAEGLLPMLTKALNIKNHRYTRRNTPLKFAQENSFNGN